MATSRSNLVSATLLRRLAEAIDGYRDGKRHWFVVKDGKRIMMRGPFSSAAAAGRDKRAAGPGYRVFGPYRMANDGGAAAIKVVVTSRKGGHEWTRTYYPPDVDAIVFTMSAYDKFIAPYYANIDGLDEARRKRHALSAGPFEAVVHTPPTIYEQDNARAKRR